MMRQITILLACLLMLSLAGCNRNNNGNSSSIAEPSSEPVVESEPEVLPEEPDEDEDGKTTFTVDGDISVTVDFDNAVYNHDTIVGTTVTVTNNSDNTIAYVVGSGSNVAPEALQYRLGNLAPMFRPEIMTSDYRTEVLRAGETATFQLNYAPYVSVDEDRNEFGVDLDLDFFRTDDFTPAETGRVEGKLVFEYRVLPEDVDEDNLLADFDSLDPVKVELEFHTNIDAADIAAADGLGDDDNDDDNDGNYDADADGEVNDDDQASE